MGPTYNELGLHVVKCYLCDQNLVLNLSCGKKYVFWFFTSVAKIRIYPDESFIWSKNEKGAVWGLQGLHTIME